MEAGLKLARRYHFLRGDESRQRFVSTHGSFHGRTMGSVSITGQSKYHEGFGSMVDAVSMVDFGDLDATEKALSTKDVAAFIVEPVQGNSGVRPAPLGYLSGLRELCDRYGTLLIFDEIQTGVGRTGKWFAHQHSPITPDIMALAKALGGGIPLGAMVATEEVGQSLTLGCHGTTFGGNPVACAAGLATMDILQQDGIVDDVGAKGARFMEALRVALGDHEDVVEIRGQGLMIGIEVKSSGKQFRDRCQKAGLLGTSAGPNVLRLLPPLNITEAQLDEAVKIIAQSL